MSEPELDTGPARPFSRQIFMDTRLSHRKFVTRITSVVVTALCATTAAQAAPAQGFVLTAYSDAVGGERLLSGQYSAALVQIRGAKTGAGGAEVVRKTNACVAYAVLGKLSEARVACDAALAAATLDRSHAKGVVSRSRSEEDSSVAIAYSNRAIVHSLSNEAVGSAEDLAEAHSLAPQSAYVVRNIAAFKQAPGSLTQLEVAAHRMED
jgi:hypothetical protein